MEFNKLAAAVLIAGLIGIGTGKISGFLYGGAEDAAHHGEGEHHVARGYSIDVPEEGALDSAGAADAPAGPAPISALLASADVAAGEAFFAKRCALCHNIEKGGANKTGPGLWNVVGSDKGTHAGFSYSKAMAEKPGNWGFEELNGFLHNPKKWLPGTIMAYAGIKKDDERANLIAYLRTQADAPLPLPAP